MGHEKQRNKSAGDFVQNLASTRAGSLPPKTGHHPTQTFPVRTDPLLTQTVSGRCSYIRQEKKRKLARDASEKMIEGAYLTQMNKMVKPKHLSPKPMKLITLKTHQKYI